MEENTRTHPETVLSTYSTPSCEAQLSKSPSVMHCWQAWLTFDLCTWLRKNINVRRVLGLAFLSDILSTHWHQLWLQKDTHSSIFKCFKTYWVGVLLSLIKLLPNGTFESKANLWTHFKVQWCWKTYVYIFNFLWLSMHGFNQYIFETLTPEFQNWLEVLFRWAW